jgi:hypothetical protein
MTFSMSGESDSDVEDMAMPEFARLTRPLSSAVLGFLDWKESPSAYHETTVEPGENEKTAKYFHTAFYYRTRFYLPLFILITGVAVLDATGAIRFTIEKQAYGLLLDFFGAIFIASGLFRGVEGIQRDTPMRDPSARYEGSNPWYSPASLTSSARDTVDALYGATYLITGFLLQLLAVAVI